MVILYPVAVGGVYNVTVAELFEVFEHVLLSETFVTE